MDELKKRNPEIGAYVKRHLACAAALVLLALLSARPVSAWGWIGHRVVARMAEERLNARTRAAVAGILGPGAKLADVSTWADEQQELTKTGPWHSVNIPLEETRYNPRYCPPPGCIVGKIVEFGGVLRNPAAGKSEKQRALKFLIHLIADLHQPMHVGDNGTRGGNLLQVRFYGEGSNLHKVWDYQIMERHTKNLGVWLWDLTFEANPKRVAEWSKGTPEEWATESLNLAKSAYRLPGSQAWILPGTNLGTRYSGASLPGIRKQLAKAAIRIAWVLNGIFSQ